MALENSRRHLNVSRNSRDSRALSWISEDADGSEARIIKEEIDCIRISLDNVRDNLISQQCMAARDMEDRIRNIYDSVVNDINEVRKKVNSIGDTFAPQTKFNTWVPAAPFRKDILQSVYEIKATTKLKGSKSVDFVDSIKDAEAVKKDTGQFMKTFSRRRRLQSSNSSIDSNSSKSTVPGYGCCFNGDNKTLPYRTYRHRFHSIRNPRHSWGPSRSGSRSTLDDFDGPDDADADDRGCLCGDITDDWRVKVAPYMWEGWPLHGVEKSDVIRLKERLEKLEEMRQETFSVHNEYRRQHDCPALSLADDLSRDAQQWAEILALKGYAQYSDSQSRGENILVIDIDDVISGRQVTDTWYREGKNYNYKQPQWQRGTSNFTQMIWKNSRHIGIGIARFPHNDTYVFVVQYQPPGNINTPGQFRRNVPIPRLDGPTESTDTSFSALVKPINDMLDVISIESDIKLTVPLDKSSNEIESMKTKELKDKQAEHMKASQEIEHSNDKNKDIGLKTGQGKPFNVFGNKSKDIHTMQTTSCIPGAEEVYPGKTVYTETTTSRNEMEAEGTQTKVHCDDTEVHGDTGDAKSKEMMDSSVRPNKTDKTLRIKYDSVV